MGRVPGVRRARGRWGGGRAVRVVRVRRGRAGAGGRRGPARAAVTFAGANAELGAAREIVARLNDPDTGGRYERWVERARGCRHPVRLSGVSRDADAATGDVVREFASEDEPDGVLLTPCGNRRASACPPCSEVYRGD